MSLPSTATSLPFFKYLPATSASLPQITRLCHCVSSTFSPFWFLYESLVAMEKAAFFLSPKVFTSGSLPRRPMSCTLFLRVLIVIKFKLLRIDPELSGRFCVNLLFVIDHPSQGFG